MKAFCGLRSVLKCLRGIVCVSLIFNFQFSIFNSAQGQTAVGHWRDCLDYSWTNHVTYAGDRIYAAARGGIFCYDFEDNTLTRLCKGKGLNDVGIATMNYDPVTKCLVVAYNNSNVDLIIDGQTYNLSDIKRSEISGDKSIYHVRFANRRAYLTTGFGVVVVNLDRQEIKETWYLGSGGSYTAVYDLAFMTDSLYAATGEGLKRLSSNETHPTVSDRWDVDHRFDDMTLFELAVVGSHLLVAANSYMPGVDNLYTKTDTGFALIYSDELHSLHVGGSYLAVSTATSVRTYDTAMNYLGEVSNYYWGGLVPNDAVYGSDGTLWVAHQWEGIIGLHPDGTEEYHAPDGPSSGDNTYRLVPFNYRMMLCPGGHSSIYANTYLPPNLFTAVGRQWSLLAKSN